MTDASIGWTVDTLRQHVRELMAERESRADERDRRMEERFREKDLRDQQRFDAQQKALTDALLAQQKAQADALLAQEKAVTAALQAANAAVGKAEVASEKRFDAVNEFRQTVEDLSKLQMTKAEAGPQFDFIREKIAEFNDRMNRENGRGQGISQFWGVLVAILGVGLAVGALLVTLLR